MRNQSADLLKCLLLVLVIVGHVFTSPLGTNPYKGLIYLYHMPVFLALAGYFFAAERGVGTTWKAAWPRYVRPWILASLVYFAEIYLRRHKPPFTLARAILDPWYHLWFVPCLLWYSTLVATLRRFGRSATLLVFVALALAYQALFAGGAWPRAIDERYLSYGYYFALGHALRSFFAEREPARFVWFWLPAAAWAAAYFYGIRNLWLQELARAASCTAALAWVVARERAPHPAFVRLYSRESLAIYLYHVLALRLVVQGHPSLPDGVRWLLCLVIGLVLVPVAVAQLRRLPGAAWLLGTVAGGNAGPQAAHGKT